MVRTIIKLCIIAVYIISSVYLLKYLYFNNAGNGIIPLFIIYTIFFILIAKNLIGNINKPKKNSSKPYRYISAEVRHKVWERDGGKCVKCGSRKDLEFDHIIPVSKGGSNSAKNIRLLCRKHNRKKSDKI
jgi:hypothetical protein